MGNIKVFKIFLHDQIGVVWVVSSSGFLNMWSGVWFQLMYIEVYHLGKVALRYDETESANMALPALVNVVKKRILFPAVSSSVALVL